MNTEILGALELLSIADGYKALDTMLKSAPIRILKADIINPGKFLILFTGDIASVEIALDAGIECGCTAVRDHIIITGLNPQVLPVLDVFLLPTGLDALGVIESNSISGAIKAADRAAKEADVELLSIRTGNEAGGRGILTISGAIADVESAMEAAAEELAEQERFFSKVIIPAPHADFKGVFSGDR